MEELRSQTEDSKAIQISHSRKFLPSLTVEEREGGGKAKASRWDLGSRWKYPMGSWNYGERCSHFLKMPLEGEREKYCGLYFLPYSNLQPVFPISQSQLARTNR